MAEGYKDFVAGQGLAAADLEDYCELQTTMRFASSAARSTALSGILTEGLRTALKDEDREYVYDGSAHVRTGWWSSSGRTGVTLQRISSQTLPANASTDLAWDTEAFDSDGFITTTSSTITIPSGCDGIYGITFAIAKSSGSGTMVGARLVAGSQTYTGFEAVSYDGGGDRIDGSIIVPLAAANTIVLSAYVAANTVNVAAIMYAYRLGR